MNSNGLSASVPLRTVPIWGWLALFVEQEMSIKLLIYGHV